MRTKRELAIFLSRLQSFEKPSIRLEQYPTDSEIAAHIIWDMQLNNEIQDKTIADLGCGTGILGIGCMFFNPKKVYFVDKDRFALKRLKENLELQDLKIPFEIFEMDINSFENSVDVVIQNPPFGTKQEHADKVFLEKAFSISNLVYSFHKTSTEKFVKAITKDFNFKITRTYDFLFPIKRVHDFHTKDKENIKASCYKLVKND